MKKTLKTLFSLSILTCMLTSPLQATTSCPQTIPFQEPSLSQEQLEDGVTVLITRNNDGTYNQEVYDDEDIALSSVPRSSFAGDGVIDVAAFHLGFKDWNEDTDCLYFNVSADETLSYVDGNVYVKSTSILHPESFYNDRLHYPLFGSSNTGGTIAYVNTGDETKVRVGYSDLYIVAISGSYANMGSASKVVNR